MPKSAMSHAVKLLTSGRSPFFLNGVAMNAAAALRTATIPVGTDWSKLLVWVFLDRSAATDLTWTVSGRHTAGGRLYPVSIRDTSVDPITRAQISETSGTISADYATVIELDCRGFEEIVIPFAATSGGASDLLYVEATGVAGN